MSNSINYKDAGVNIEEGYRAVQQMKAHVEKTFNSNVLADIGSFGGLFQLPMDGIKTPVLVSGTDGVGTKLKLAFMADKHDTVGIDLVAMCVNDVLCQGARPLFFLDYMATGKLSADRAADIVGGIAKGCKASGCALIGGETAEMPGFYADGEYDLAGFTVGLVDKDKIIDGSKVSAGDVLIGLPSTGVHSNGFSLVRKLIFDVAGYKLSDKLNGTDQTIKDILLTPTALYVNQVLPLIKADIIKGAAHITGGGFIENIPRTLPAGTSVKIDRAAWQVPPIFKKLQSIGNLDDDAMFNTFNMGIGFVLIVDKDNVKTALDILTEGGQKAYIIGDVVHGDKSVIL